MSVAALPYVVLTGLFFGTSLIATRFATGQFAPSTFTGLRLIVASIGFAAVYIVVPLRKGGRRPWPTDPSLWRHALLLGLLGVTAPMFLTVLTLQYLSSGVTSMLASTGPAVTVILAHFFLRDERLTWRKGGGVALALSGAMFLAISGQSGLANSMRSPWIGYLLMGGSLLSVSFVTIYARRFMRGYRSLDVASTQLFVATLVAAPLLLFFSGPALGAIDWRGALALLYAALTGTLLAIMLYYENVRRFGATAAAMTQYVIPVVATLGGLLLLGEQFTLAMAIGIGLIIGGITLLRQ